MTLILPTLSVPAGVTVLAAMALGLLPADAQATGFAGLPNPTIAQLLSAGLISSTTLVSALGFTNPVTYGGS